MAKQLSGPVLWVDLIRKLSRHYHRPFVEIGPGQVISRAVKWIDRNIEIVSTETNDRVLGVIKRSRVL